VALISVIAPTTPVEVAGMDLPNATVERVELRAGVNPLVYFLTWRDGPSGPLRRCSFRGDQVTEKEQPAGAVPAGSNRLADLGRAMAAAAAGGS
jgi:hypothetical protein